MTLGVAVSGAAGRMGAEVCRAVAAAPDLELVGAVDPVAEGRRVQDLVIGASPERLRGTGTAVVVDFSEKMAALETLEWCARNHVHAVVGTTGFESADLRRIGAWFPSDGPLGCVIAPNFALGAVLLMHFARLAAPWFASAEIVELHHDGKRDAPSGTALRTAETMAAARKGPFGADPTTTTVLPGARGGEGPAGIRVHSVRLRGLVAHQEVLLGTDGETLTLRHDSLDRASFMPGVLLAVRSVGARPGLTVGLETFLELPSTGVAGGGTTPR